jgi:hypothetical protein
LLIYPVDGLSVDSGDGHDGSGARVSSTAILGEPNRNLQLTGLLGAAALPVAGPVSWDITSANDPKNLAYGQVQSKRHEASTVIVLADSSEWGG